MVWPARVSTNEFATIFFLPSYKTLGSVGKPVGFPLAPSFRRFAPVIWERTPSSGNTRHAHRLRVVRVAFPQRLLYRTPLRGCKTQNTFAALPSPNELIGNSFLVNYSL
jgi:hypothetical protein